MPTSCSSELTFLDKLLVLYEKGNVDQVIELTHYYLDHGEEREDIAWAGREAVLAAHTSAHRADAILHLMQTENVSYLVRRRKAQLRAIEYQLSLAYGTLAALTAAWPSHARFDAYRAMAAAIRTNLTNA